ncbi:MAG: response regulator transcription factor [bacterium]
MYLTDSAPQITIVIVEDENLYKKVIIDFLQEDSAFKVVGEAKDGQTAVNLAKELRPDVIIMDLGLPVISGTEATKKIKETNSFIKIIALTAHSDKNEAIDSLIAGASAYVNKDIKIQHLKMIIQTVNEGAIWLSPVIGFKVFSEILKLYKHK